MRNELLLLLLAVGIPACAQQDRPASVSLCELEANPSAFNQKLIELHGWISMEFEDFTLHDPNCDDFKNSVWLTFGGDVSDPIIYCCGNHDRPDKYRLRIEGFDIPLEKDETFFRLLPLIKAYRRPAISTKDDEDYPRNYYKVTTTLVGRFFSGEKWVRKDGVEFYRGYGHLGCCTLFAIEKVVSIDRVTSNAKPEDLKCSADFWRGTEDKESLRGSQKAASRAELWRMRQPLRVAREALTDRMLEWNDSKNGTFPKACKLEKWYDQLEKSSQYSASCNWISDDHLDEYQIQLQKHGFLKKTFGSWNDVVWMAAWVQRNSCARE